MSSKEKMNQDEAPKPVILMVDDIPANLHILFDLLSEAGFEVLVAEDGESALARAQYTHPDLILLDVLMADMDGFETCRRLKDNPDTQSIPVIFMTSVVDTGDKVKGFRLGAVDYITKPFQIEEVLARINTHLTLQRLKTALQEKEERLSHIIAGALDAIITLDAAGRITLFNSAAEQVFRCPAPAAIGQLFANFLSPGSQPVLDKYRQEPDSQRAGRTAFWLPEGLMALRADGEVFPIEATLSRVEAGGQPLYTLILRDINERKKSEAERHRLQGLNRYLQEEAWDETSLKEPIGDSPAFHTVMAVVHQVAGTDATVLVTGETGTGKEVIARTLHRQSRRRDQPLITLNCTTIPKDLAESELFGHEKGAFTGALTRKTGRFELADRGTLFLDEIGELPLDLQAKLLRVLQDGEFEHVGGTHTVKVDVRIIAATNRDLKHWAEQGQFRPDLYYRLNVFPIHLPPLRERSADIPLLVSHFVHKYATKYGKKITMVAEETMQTLAHYSWPGNIRELQHLIERAVILTSGLVLEVGDWFVEPSHAMPSPAASLEASNRCSPIHSIPSHTTPSPASTLEEVERAHIVRTLEQTGWRVSGAKGAARLLGLQPTTLQARMKKLGITR
jgi:PAS domain S-box-containing protein